MNKPFIKSTFEKHTEKRTRFVLVSHIGETINSYPSIWKIGKDKGRQYIGFRKTVKPKVLGKRYFEYTFELAGSKLFTGVNFTLEYPNLAYGDDKSIGGNNAVLVRFSNNGNTLEIFFYKNMADNAQTLFEQWTTGQLSEVVEKVNIL